MIDWEGRAKVLETENDELRSRVRQLEEAIGIADEPPLVFGLTKNESIMFGVMMNNRSPRKETFMPALFSDRIDDAPDIKIVDVWICKMRRKLRPFGIEIKTCWGAGYEMPEASKAIARELIAAT
jgi:two-component system cell cycle response regulator CtrA